MNNWIMQHPLLTLLAILGVAIVCAILDVKYIQPKDLAGPR